MLEPAVQLRIVAPVLDHAAGMRDCGPIAGEESADLGKTEPADDMSEIHRDLAGERRSWRASRRCPQIMDVYLEHRRDGGVDDLPHRQVSAALGIPKQLRRRSEPVQPTTNSSRCAPFLLEEI